MCLDKIVKYPKKIRTLVISTVKVIENSWQEEIDKWHLGKLSYAYITGNVKAKDRIPIIESNPDVLGISTSMLDWYIKNTCTVLRKRLLKSGKMKYYYDVEKIADRFDLIIIDESSLFKNYGSERFKNVKKWVSKIPNVMLLSATPSPKNIENLWAQIYLIDSGQRLGKNITEFRSRYAIHVPMSNGRIRYQYTDAAVNEVLNLIKDVVTSIPYPDKPLFPEPIMKRLYIKPDEDTAKLLNQFKEDYITQIGGKQLVALSKNQLIIKVNQIASGSVYIKQQAHPIHDLKLRALEYKLSQIKTPVLIFYTYVFDKEKLLKLPGAKLLETPQDFKDWNANKIQLAIMSPFSTAHGLNIQYSECRHVFWYSPIWDTEIWIQANARVCRRGQKHTVTIGVFLLRGSFDQMIFDINYEKYKAQYNHLEKLR